MGNSFSCNDEFHLQRLAYDMTSIREKKLPILWMNGVPCAGCRSIAALLGESYGFQVINIVDIIQEESTNDTDRAKLIKENAMKKKQIPAPIIVDLVKESMLKTEPGKTGYLIIKFPSTNLQAEMFVKEIGNADLVLYLFAELPSIIERMKTKTENSIPIDVIKRETQQMEKQLVKVLRRYSPRIEKIETNDEAPQIFYKIQEIIVKRMSINKCDRGDADSIASAEKKDADDDEVSEKVIMEVAPKESRKFKYSKIMQYARRFSSGSNKT